MHSVIYYSAFDLFDAFARNTFSNSETTEGENDYILNCDLLIIDDLGTGAYQQFSSFSVFPLHQRADPQKEIHGDFHQPDVGQFHGHLLRAGIFQSFQ